MLSHLLRASPLLEVFVSGERIASVAESDLPCEKLPVVQFERGAVMDIRGASMPAVRHDLAFEEGFAHFSIRVSTARACEIDCAVTSTPTSEPTGVATGRAAGIRFQPFLLPGAHDTNDTFAGHGLFLRGLHYSGVVTPGNVSLACTCDRCAETFRIQSFHAGFSCVGYMYSASGAFTLTIAENIPGAPPALGQPDPDALALLERRLPLAPDGSAFRYLNPFRCPHCQAPYIDFEQFPREREREYYGNVFMGETPLRYEPGVGAP